MAHATSILIFKRVRHIKRKCIDREVSTGKVAFKRRGAQVGKIICPKSAAGLLGHTRAPGLFIQQNESASDRARELLR